MLKMSQNPAATQKTHPVILAVSEASSLMRVKVKFALYVFLNLLLVNYFLNYFSHLHLSQNYSRWNLPNVTGTTTRTR